MRCVHAGLTQSQLAGMHDDPQQQARAEQIQAQALCRMRDFYGLLHLEVAMQGVQGSYGMPMLVGMQDVSGCGALQGALGELSDSWEQNAA